MVNKKLLSLGIILFSFLLFFWIWWNFLAKRVVEFPAATPFTLHPISGKEIPKEMPLVSVVVKNLEVPWSLDFLSDGSLIFTERPGRIRIFDPKKRQLSEPLEIEEVAGIGEGGLLGLALHPNFEENGFLYVYYTYRNEKGLANRVVKFKLEDNKFLEKKIIIDNIPGAINHNGGRIKFGPDGFLYITTGDAQIPELAQNKNSLAGKILRIRDDGSIPTDNPFPNSPVFSLGHRNPQGLAWDEKGQLFVTEHGAIGTDEINLIEPKKNYGWPIIKGNEKAEGLENPIIHSGKETWAPSGIIFWKDSLFFSGLRSQSLYQIKIKGEKISPQKHFSKNFGRLRDVVLGPDGFLYLLSSNRDGRGIPFPDDDKIIRVNPAPFLGD